MKGSCRSGGRAGHRQPANALSTTVDSIYFKRRLFTHVHTINADVSFSICMNTLWNYFSMDVFIEQAAFIFTHRYKNLFVTR